jgi:hypothetical protein
VNVGRHGKKEHQDAGSRHKGKIKGLNSLDHGMEIFPAKVGKILTPGTDCFFYWNLKKLLYLCTRNNSHFAF